MQTSLAPFASAAMLLLSFNALTTSFMATGGCGTPRAFAALEIFAAPLFLIVPFINLLWAKNLSAEGVFARGTVTCSVGVWMASLVALFFAR